MVTKVAQDAVMLQELFSQMKEQRMCVQEDKKMQHGILGSSEDAQLMSADSSCSIDLKIQKQNQGTESKSGKKTRRGTRGGRKKRATIEQALLNQPNIAQLLNECLRGPVVDKTRSIALSLATTNEESTTEDPIEPSLTKEQNQNQLKQQLADNELIEEITILKSAVSKLQEQFEQYKIQTQKFLFLVLLVQIIILLVVGFSIVRIAFKSYN